MKLVKCYVSSFGKLKDFSYDFSSGLNIFKENNGWGKTTLATFIKSMFYGLNSTKRSVSENERLKYKPWNSTERFGGFVQFEWGGNEYKIERFFGTKESDDSVRLFDVKTGKEYSNTSDLGRRIFEIDEEGFLSTTYFSQKDFQVKSNTSLTAKFNAVCEVQDTDAFDRALLKVEEKAKTYKYRGDKGLIADIKREIFEVGDKIEQAIKSSDAIKVVEFDVKNAEQKAEELKKQITILTDKVTQAGRVEALKVKKERYNELVVKREKLLLDKEQNERVLNGYLPDAREINACFECNNELGNVLASERLIENDLASLETANAQKKDKSKSVKIKTPIVVFGVSIILLIACIIAMASQGIASTIGLIFGSIFALSLVVAVILLFNSRTKPSDTVSGYAELIDRKRSELNGFREIKQKYLERIDGFISRFNLGFEVGDRFSALSAISKHAEEYRRVTADLNEVNKEISSLEEGKESFNAFESSNIDVSSIKIELQRAQSEYARITGEIAHKKATLKMHGDFASSISELESKRSELKQRLAQYTEDYKTLTLTAEYLQKADENLKIKYRAPLEDSLNKYLTYIDSGASHAAIDVDLTVTVEEKDGRKATDYYSKGYQNLFEICKRFALTDVLFKAEKPFIILDDPFYNLDDDKLSLSLELVKKLSEEYQIIYFVCHESRRA